MAGLARSRGVRPGHERAGQFHVADCLGSRRNWPGPVAVGLPFAVRGSGSKDALGVRGAFDWNILDRIRLSRHSIAFAGDRIGTGKDLRDSQELRRALHLRNPSAGRWNHARRNRRRSSCSIRIILRAGAAAGRLAGVQLDQSVGTISCARTRSIGLANSSRGTLQRYSAFVSPSLTFADPLRAAKRDA